MVNKNVEEQQEAVMDVHHLGKVVECSGVSLCTGRLVPGLRFEERKPTIRIDEGSRVTLSVAPLSVTRVDLRLAKLPR